MKKQIKLGKLLTLGIEKLNQLNDQQLNHFSGGRMAAATGYTTQSPGQCSTVWSACCS